MLEKIKTSAEAEARFWISDFGRLLASGDAAAARTGFAGSHLARLRRIQCAARLRRTRATTGRQSRNSRPAHPQSIVSTKTVPTCQTSTIKLAS